jgi:endothelin-converting enzyme/putative endopeptidase
MPHAHLALTLAGVLVAAAAAAQTPTPPPNLKDPVDAPGPRRVPGFDPQALDRKVEPCQDFYQFACGGWLRANPVPPDRARWGRFDELAERNQETLRDILQDASAATNARAASERDSLARASGGPGGRGAAPPSIDDQIGTLYASCMDEAAAEKAGLAPLEPTLRAIAAIDSREALARELAKLHLSGVFALFAFGAQQDFEDATKVIAAVDQSGLGLPDRDYYLKDEARFTKVREAYAPHVQRMLQLAGRPPAEAEGRAKTIVALETKLAKAFLERVKRRDPAMIYHPMPRAKLEETAPALPWSAYFAALGHPAPAELNVTWPDYFEAVSAELSEGDLAAWKAYLEWQVIRAAAPLLSRAFVEADFDFYGRTLTGAKELRPRWKRCVALVDDNLGEALGRRYVEKTFGAEGKQRMAAMVDALEHALAEDIESLPWMTAATKARAQAKLSAISNKIGYPERWRDYSAVRIERGDLLGNVRRAAEFEFRRDLAKIGRPVDPGEWLMTPPTVNAYYMPLQNNINFPAGILQPPFFERAMDDAVNFGAIGAVIGHELTHGFDDSGRKFGPTGNLEDWWTDEDGKEFERRARCFVEQYGNYTVAGDVKLNGKLTLGENVADNGGVRIAHMALRHTLGGKAVPPKDGFTPEQRLFLGWGQIWCQNQTDESARLRAQTDPHSPGRYRVNGVVSNMPEFAAAFSCRAGQPMVRENACRVW